MNLTAALISSSVIRMKGTGERSISRGVEVVFLFFRKERKGYGDYSIIVF